MKDEVDVKWILKVCVEDVKSMMVVDWVSN